MFLYLARCVDADDDDTAGGDVVDILLQVVKPLGPQCGRGELGGEEFLLPFTRRGYLDSDFLGKFPFWSVQKIGSDFGCERISCRANTTTPD